MEEKLIEFVRNNKILYDKTHQVNQPVEKVKKRWKTIRDRYYRILKDDRCASTSGRGKKVPAADKYKYFEQLSFVSECEHFNSSTVGNFDCMDIFECEDENSKVYEVSDIENIHSSSTPRWLKKKAELEVNKEMLVAITSFKKRENKSSPIMPCKLKL